jgi:hypothetical protein
MRGLETAFTTWRFVSWRVYWIASDRLVASVSSSRAESRQKGNSQVDSVSDCLCEVAVGAELLAEADEDEGLNEPV